MKTISERKEWKKNAKDDGYIQVPEREKEENVEIPQKEEMIEHILKEK